MIAELLTVGGSEFRSGADERSPDEMGLDEDTVPLPDGEEDIDGLLVLVWTGPGEDDGIVGCDPVDEPVFARGVDDPDGLEDLELD